MSRPRRRLQRLSSSESNTSSTSTSPERGIDDDNDSLMLQANDSQSSLGLELNSDQSQSDSARREYEERCRVSPVHRLPAELLISIFSRLSMPSDLRACMLVSKEWARNSVGLLWHRPAMNTWPSIHSVVQSIRKADKFFAYQELVKRLNMSTLASQISDGTVYGMVDCKRIERLTLTNCSKLTDASLFPLISGNRSLLALDVTGLEQVTDKTMENVAGNCLRLQGLNVTGCKRLTDVSISAIAKGCRHLKRLKFNGCVQLTDNSIMTIAAHSTHLLEIDLYGLQFLESPAVTALLTSCPHLRELRLAHCSRLTDAAFLDIPYEPELPVTFDFLRILDLTDCIELGDKGVEKIVQTCPRLRNLILAKCRQITDRAVFAITKLSKNLHFIHLGHCVRITDLSVEALAKACNRIRYIDLACCVNLTDSSVVKLATLPKLKRIGLVKCAGITDRSIYALAMGEMKGGRRLTSVSALERVHLSYCTQLTLEGIHVLLNNCPKLTHLSLTGVQAFLRDELLAFCREAPPEFNEHQRDVFCVFSGQGVGRLREFLNQQKAHAVNEAAAAAAREGSISGSLAGDEHSDGDLEGTSLAVHQSQSPLMFVHIPGNQIGGVGSSAAAGAGEHYVHAPPHGHSVWQSPTAGYGHGHLSQSAPASTTTVLWRAGGSSHPVHASTSHFGGAGGSTATLVGVGSGAEAHVTGMMGATVLDEVDEVDETLGDGSEIMND